MPADYLHGIQVVQKAAGTRAIRMVNSSIIGIVGTAPNAQAAAAASAQSGTEAGNDGITYTAVAANAAGNNISVLLKDPKANSQALAVSMSGTAITVSLATDAAGAVTSTAADVIAAIAGDANASALIGAANTGASTGATVVTAMTKQLFLSGGLDDAFPLNTPVPVFGDRAKAAKLDTVGTGLGTLPAAMDAIFDQIAPIMVVVRVAEGANAAETQSNIIGTVTAGGQYTGMQALLTAQTKLALKPRILGAPGFTDIAVHAAMDSIADALRAFAYYDLGSATADAAATDRANYGKRRCMLLWPAWEVWDTAVNGMVVQPASARALGLRAKIDNDIGWHKTLSNVDVNGVTGISKPVEFDLQNPNCKANYLNSNEVTTMIRRDGFRFWGSRTPAADPAYAFESAVRTDDILADTIAEAHFWAMDKPMSKQLFDEIVNGINAKFRELKAFGYIVDAVAWLDPELNTNESMSAGKLWINYEFTPVPPLEQLGFQATITNKYLIELLPDSNN